MFCSALAKIFVDQFYYCFGLRHPLLFHVQQIKTFLDAVGVQRFHFPCD